MWIQVEAFIINADKNNISHIEIEDDDTIVFHFTHEKPNTLTLYNKDKVMADGSDKYLDSTSFDKLKKFLLKDYVNDKTGNPVKI